MNVISYYDKIPTGECELHSYRSDFSKECEDLIPLWKQTWTKYGWNPIVLNKKNAINNSVYHALDLNNPNSNFYKTNPTGSFKYNRSCYLRLLAYCEYVKRHGPTLYCDYDVMNYGFTPDILSKYGFNSIFCEQRSIIYLDKNGAQDIERVLIEFNDANETEWCHRNDMRLMEYKTKVFYPVINDIGDYIYCCSSNTKRDNETLLVHYNGGCYRRGASKKLSRSEIVIKHGRI